jgi:hypothetical protein
MVVRSGILTIYRYINTLNVSCSTTLNLLGVVGIKSIAGIVA